MSIHIEKYNKNWQICIDINGLKTHLPALWLRERTLDPTQVDTKTKQRLFNPHLLDPELSISAATAGSTSIDVKFSDGYQYTYPVDYLTGLIANVDQDLPPLTPWLAETKLDATYDWQELLSNRALFLQSIKHFLRYGYIILQNTPTERDSILSIANYFGKVRDTNFGQYFEVYSKPNANDLAYTPHAIGPHTDNPYRDPVPGIQLLHCLKNHTEGGYSTLADGLSIIAALKAKDPEGFKLLTDTVVRFGFFDSGTELISFHPLIEKDALGNVSGIHYSPRLDDLPLLPEARLQHYQQARKLLGTLMQDSRFEKKFKLCTAELMMFDNNRIVHGRTAFDPRQGVRHLQGCYIDRDGLKSLYRVANRQWR